MLALVGSLVSFLYLRPEVEVESRAKYEVSQLKLTGLKTVKVAFPAKAPVIFEKKDGYWMMKAPHKQRADQLSVQRILSVIAATSDNKFPATDLTKYGLDNPLVRLTLINDGGEEHFVYGTYNTVTDEQYVGYNDSVYLLNSVYSEAASTPVVEMIDRNFLAPDEVKQLTGFDYSHLEQWEEASLNVDVEKGEWKTNLPEAKPTQNELNEWLEFSWKQNPAKSVKLYKPDHSKSYPSFKVKLADGTSIHVDKLMESPDLVLARPDEGLIYHFSNDVGFTMLNPPLHLE